ncbi:TraC family protein [Agrobacterium vitis]|uniref:TraC family protein n=1 Tax=Agrobacterium vitis TaxID=373 RepID=A0A6L6VGM2_AGRVI|nr:conjugal transfer protein TraC [Agrobacterium vitis]MUZ74726.1 TraC family protein [Agrobacterium vitis]
MKKPSSKIREEIARLQEQLKAAETREAERIGRVALRAGLGEIEIDEVELQAAFEEVAKRFRAGGKASSIGKERAGQSSATGSQPATVETGAAQGNTGEG